MTIKKYFITLCLAGSFFSAKSDWQNKFSYFWYGNSHSALNNVIRAQCENYSNKEIQIPAELQKTNVNLDRWKTWTIFKDNIEKDPYSLKTIARTAFYHTQYKSSMFFQGRFFVIGSLLYLAGYCTGLTGGYKKGRKFGEKWSKSELKSGKKWSENGLRA